MLDATDFTTQNPTCVNRQQPTVKSGILKIGEYKAHSGKYDSLDLEPGDNLLKARLLTEFTPTTLTFQNHKQFVSSNKAISKMRDESGQSLESFYLNTDGTLDYQKMVVELDSLIARGVTNPLKELDKGCHRQRDSKRSKTHVNSENGINLVHPHKEFLEYIKDQLNQ